MPNANNPYTTFVRSLTDEQLDLLESAWMVNDEDFIEAVQDEAENRERRTSLTFYTPHIENFKRLLANDMNTDSEIDRNAFVAALRKRLFEKRILNGWTYELEDALKVLIIEMVEQLEQKP